MKSKFSPIIRDSYTIKAAGEDIEITAYGEIVDERPRDFWTDKEKEGSYIVQDEFLKDLDMAVSSGAKKITLRINSLGGDAAVSVTIHNRIRELSEKGISTACIVDGVAMSGGSLIMCGCDHVKVYPASLIMIHKAISSACGWYNADELRQMAIQSDVWNKAQAAIYCRKTGLSETIIMHMMSDTTYMTGSEAVTKGFADELTEGDTVPVAVNAARTELFVGERRIMLPHGFPLPSNIPISTSAEDDENKNRSENTDQKEGYVMAKNLEELRTENPELAAQIEADAKKEAETKVEAERKRIKEIDALASLFDAEMLNDAKYDHPCNASDLTYRVAQNAAKEGKDFLKKMEADNKASGAEEVETVPHEEKESPVPKTDEE